jgi:hypothetical protein
MSRKGGGGSGSCCSQLIGPTSTTLMGERIVEAYLCQASWFDEAQRASGDSFSRNLVANERRTRTQGTVGRMSFWSSARNHCAPVVSPDGGDSCNRTAGGVVTRFTRADLTLAALTAPIWRPSEHPTRWPAEALYPGLGAEVDGRAVALSHSRSRPAHLSRAPARHGTRRLCRGMTTTGGQGGEPGF